MKKLVVLSMMLMLVVAGGMFNKAHAVPPDGVFYTANNLADMNDITILYYEAISAQFHVNGYDVFLNENFANGTTEYYVNGVLIGAVFENDMAGAALLLTKYFGLPLTSPGSVQDQNAASTTVTRLVFQELVVPAAETKAQMEASEKRDKSMGMRTFGGSLRYDLADNDGDDGNVYGLNIGMAYDADELTFGLMIPFDRLNFDSYEADRVGAILFGQRHAEYSERLTATYTVNVNYLHAALDFESGRDESIKTVGAGFSYGLNYDLEDAQVGAGISYQYNKDSVDSVDDSQKVFRFGSNFGYRIMENQVVNIFGNWTKDVTDYEFDYGDDDYFELGAEYQMDVSDVFALSVGYKKVLDLNDYDGDTIYLGSVWKY